MRGFVFNLFWKHQSFYPSCGFNKCLTSHQLSSPSCLSNHSFVPLCVSVWRTHNEPTTTLPSLLPQLQCSLVHIVRPFPQLWMKQVHILTSINSLPPSQSTTQRPQGATGQTQPARGELETYCWHKKIQRLIVIQLSASVYIKVKLKKIKISFNIKQQKLFNFQRSSDFICVNVTLSNTAYLILE